MLNQAETVVVSVTVILGVLAIVAVGLRFYCRSYGKMPIYLDDYLVLIAVLISTGIAILTDYVACTNDIGDQSHEPSLDSVIFALKANFALENFQILGLGLVKVALLLFYRRVFALRSFEIAADILIGIMSTFCLAIILVNIFDKWPVYEQWNPTAPYTVNAAALLIAFVAGNAALDVVTFCLPLMVIRMLNVSVGKKLFLGVVFGLGSITIVVTFLRLNYAIKYTKEKQTGNSLFQVPFIFAILMALIELPVVIIANCLLTLGPLFRAKDGPGSIFRSWWSSLVSKLSNSSSSSTARNQSRKQDSDKSTPISTSETLPVAHHSHTWDEITPKSSVKNLGSAEERLYPIDLDGEEDGRRMREVV